MQLMHMLYCLYSSSSSGVWQVLALGQRLLRLRTIHGFTRTSFRMKSPMSTIRSRMTGKLRSGSTRTGPGA